jgi:urease accessory protein
MRARAAVVAEAGPDGRTRLAVLRSQPPIMLRPTPGALYLAASAAGPLGGDDLQLSVTVGPGAQLTVRTVAAAVALPGAGGASSFTWTLSVAAGGRLAVLPEPTVVADGAEHRAAVHAEVARGGTLVLREEVLLGRHGERGGRHLSSLRVDAGGRPLLRSELALDGTDPVSTGPASAIGARACGSLLLVDPAYADRPPPGWAGPQATAMPLAGPGLLVNAIGIDAGAVRTCLDRWLANGQPRRGEPDRAILR